MPNNKNILPEILKKIELISTDLDLRIGQIIEIVSQKKQIDCFYLKDKDLLDELNKMIKFNGLKK